MEKDAGAPKKKETLVESKPEREPAEVEEVRTALAHIADCDEENTWFEIGCCLKSFASNVGESVARKLWDEWSKRSSKFDETYQDKTWERLDADKGLTVATLFQRAIEAGYTPDAVGEPANDVAVNDAAATAELESLMDQKAEWEQVSTADVWEAIKDTPIMELVQVLQAPADPPLPLELTLPKALVLAGAAMAGSITGAPNADDFTDLRHGVDLAKNVIQSGGGQTTNQWGLIVAASGTGKDIGNVFTRIAKKSDLLLGSSGSAEGICDAIMSCGNGILAISELEPFLKEHTYQRAACSLLNTAYDTGFFEHVFSSRKPGAARKTRYAFLSVLANVQPEIWAAHDTDSLKHNGFVSRYMITRGPDRICFPTRHEVDIGNALQTMRHYKKLEGVIAIPSWMTDYQRKLTTAIMENVGITHIAAIGRHINQLLPKIVAVLQADCLSPAKEYVERAAKIACWLLRQQIDLMGGSKIISRQGADLEKLMDRIMGGIRRYGGLTRTLISQRYSHGTDARLRADAISEMITRDMIWLDANVYREVRTKTKPIDFMPEVLPPSKRVYELYATWEPATGTKKSQQATTPTQEDLPMNSAQEQAFDF